MRMRFWVGTGIFALVLSLSAMANGAEYTINANAPTGGNNYRTLEELRQAGINPGDTITLYDDDATLMQALDWASFTIRSVRGSQFTVSSAAILGTKIDITAATPVLAIDSMHLVGSGVAATVVHVENTGGLASGTLTVTGSVLGNPGAANNTGVEIINLENATFTNTQILGTSTSVDMTSSEIISGSLNAVFDEAADMYNKWDGLVNITGNADVNFDVAEGKYFSIGSIESLDTPGTALTSNLTLSGGGTVKFIDGGAVGRLEVNRGTAHFGETSDWIGDNITIGSGAVFKPSVNVSNWDELARNPAASMGGSYSMFDVNSFTVDPGARLEIGNISTFRDLDEVHSAGIYALRLITAGSGNADRLSINNNLMSARLVEVNNENREALNSQFGLEAPNAFEDGYFGYYLVIDKLRNLSTLTGVGDYADAYRLNPALSEIERDMLDTIYAMGGVGEYKGFLQTLGGAIVQNSLLAMRHTQANVTSTINRRLTAYQNEELEIAGEPEYAETDPVNSYGELWATLDHDWMTQDDVAQLAGYTMSTTGLTIGYDRHEDEWIYGGALSYAMGSMKLANMTATRNDIESITAALYASWARDGWFLSGTALASHGWNDARSVYAFPGVELSGRTGNFATTGFALNVETGYMMETEFYGVPARITPYGGLTYSQFSREKVADRGARGNGVDLRKDFSEVDWNTYDASVGVRMSVPMEVNGITVVPTLDLAYTRITGERVPEGSSVRMVNNPSTGWDLDLLSTNRSSVRLAAGAEAKIKDNVSVAAGYELEWRRNYWNNRLNVNVSMDF